MPTRRTDPRRAATEALSLIVHVNCIASRHLADEFFSMSQKLQLERECPVCMEVIEGRGGLLLTCGHYCHAECWVYMRRDTCMICRT